MALTTVSVYKHVEGNNLGTDIIAGRTEGFETTNVLWFGPSTCGLDGPGSLNSAIVSVIYLKGVERTAKKHQISDIWRYGLC